LTATIPALSGRHCRAATHASGPDVHSALTFAHLVKEQYPNAAAACPPIASRAWRIIPLLARLSSPNFRARARPPLSLREDPKRRLRRRTPHPPHRRAPRLWSAASQMPLSLAAERPNPTSALDLRPPGPYPMRSVACCPWDPRGDRP